VARAAAGVRCAGDEQREPSSCGRLPEDRGEGTSCQDSHLIGWHVAGRRGDRVCVETASAVGPAAIEKAVGGAADRVPERQEEGWQVVR
jgi:hypothetical protein